VPRSAYVNEIGDASEGCMTRQVRRGLDERPGDLREAIRRAGARGDVEMETKLRRHLKQALRALRNPPETCSPFDLRSLVFGFAGPSAIAVTVDGVERAVDSKQDGAYLLVVKGERPLGPKSISIRLANGAVCGVYNPLRRRVPKLGHKCLEARRAASKRNP
jgi:hypothetical protein